MKILVKIRELIFVFVLGTAGLVSSAVAQTTLSGVALANADNPQGAPIEVSGLVGIFVVDTGGNGFGGSVQGSVFGGQSLETGSSFGASDDVIIGGNTYTFQGGDYLLSSGIEVNYTDVNTGDAFGVYLITDPSVTSRTEPLNVGSTYGFGRISSGSHAWVIPSENSGTINFNLNPSDSQLQELSGGSFGDLTAIPEPSSFATIAGLLGLAYAVSRRRRRSSSLPHS